jgi:pimeloyl-ACP methyl ester carboxylesterase
MVDDLVRLMNHLKIHKAHIVGYSLGGIIVMKFVADHPDRVQSAALGGMGWLRQGSGLQGIWERLGGGRTTGKTPPACLHGVAKLALSEDEVKSIKVPLKILIGDRDPCKRLYVNPLIELRKDIPVAEIPGAGHLNCIMNDEFKAGLEEWIGKNAS